MSPQNQGTVQVRDIEWEWRCVDRQTKQASPTGKMGPQVTKGVRITFRGPSGRTVATDQPDCDPREMESLLRQAQEMDWKDGDGASWVAEIRGGVGVGARRPGEGIPAPEPRRIIFDGDPGRYWTEYTSSKSLAELTDIELQELLKNAR